MASRTAVVRGVRSGPRTPILLAMGALALGIAAVTVVAVRAGPGFSPAASAPTGLFALLVPAFALMVGGALDRAFRPASRVGVLLYLAGCARLVAEWDNPATSALAFTVGLALYAVCPALVVHAALRYPSDRAGRLTTTVTVATGYVVTIGLLGVGPALFFVPAAQGCRGCPANLLAIADGPQLGAALTKAGIGLGLAWLLAAGGLLVFRLATSSPAKLRAVGSVLGCALFYVIAVGGSYGRSVDRGLLRSDVIERRWWLAQGLALVLLAGAVIGQLVLLRYRHRALARLVVGIGAGAGPGHLRVAIAQRLGDPGLAVAYPMNDGRHVDADAHPMDPLPPPGAAVTELHARGVHLATLVHRPDVRWPAAEVDDLIASVHLGLAHERLHAQGLAQLAELRASGIRIVSAGDDQRRRLERDLHDGAQQRLVALALGLRMLAARAPAAADAIEAAEVPLRQAIAELRDIARGLDPVVLRDAGLATALRALAETRPLRLAAAPAGRFPDVLESTAYGFVDRMCTTGPTAVTVTAAPDRLLVEATTTGRIPRLNDIADRVATLEGSIASNGNECTTTLTLPLGNRPEGTYPPV